MSDNVIAAFSEEHVSRLTGLSKTQLRYWDQTGFFTPSYSYCVISSTDGIGAVALEDR